MEFDVLNVLLDHAMVCPVNTISHIPCSVQPLLAHVLNMGLRRLFLVWGFVRLFMFAKAVLCSYVLLVIDTHLHHCVLSSIERFHLFTRCGKAPIPQYKIL